MSITAQLRGYSNRAWVEIAFNLGGTKFLFAGRKDVLQVKVKALLLKKIFVLLLPGLYVQVGGRLVAGRRARRATFCL